MNFIDIWSIIAGAASIISLLVVMSDKAPEWKKYISPAGFLLGGFAVGRISYGLSPAAGAIIKNTKFLGFLLILVLLLIVLVVFAQMMIKRKQDFYAYFVVFMVLVIGVPQVMEKYTASFSDIPKEDYLVIANIKEKNIDYSSAIHYLERYKQLSSDVEFNKKISEKISDLKNKQLEMQ